MYYQIFDLVLFYGLVAALARPRRTRATGGPGPDGLGGDLSVRRGYLGGPATAPPDVFLPHWQRARPVLVQLLSADSPGCAGTLASHPRSTPITPSDRTCGRDWPVLVACAKFVFPSVVAVAASMLIIVNATATSRSTTGLIVPKSWRSSCCCWPPAVGGHVSGAGAAASRARCRPSARGRDAAGERAPGSIHGHGCP